MLQDKIQCIIVMQYYKLATAINFSHTPPSSTFFIFYNQIQSQNHIFLHRNIGYYWFQLLARQAYNLAICTQLHRAPNYNFIVKHMSTHGATRNLQHILVMCLRGPCFLMAWNICNLPCSTFGIVRHRVAHKKTLR